MVTITISRTNDKFSDGVTYADKTFISWSDFIIDEPGFLMPFGAERTEYIPGVRLSFFLDGNQFGDGDSLTWQDGDRFIVKKNDYVANAEARKPVPPPPDVVRPSKVAEAKVAIDNYFVDPAADSKLVPVLQALRAVL